MASYQTKREGGGAHADDDDDDHKDGPGTIPVSLSAAAQGRKMFDRKVREEMETLNS